MKKKISLIAIFAVILSFTTGVVAKTVYENIKAQIRPDFVIEIDGEIKEFKSADGERVFPILHNGTTYLPIRAIGEIMGKQVYWYEDEKRIELKDTDAKKGKTTVTDADVIVKSSEKNNNDNKPVNDVAYIGEEKAKQIALEKAGLSENEVSFIKLKLERDDGIYIYDVEFRKGLIEYNAEIKADDGRIVEWDIDFDD